MASTGSELPLMMTLAVSVEVEKIGFSGSSSQVPRLMQLLEHFAGYPNNAAKILIAVKNLCLREAAWVVRLVLQREFPRVIVASLQAHAANGNFVARACEVISAVSHIVKGDAVTALTAQGTLEALVGCLSTLQEDAPPVARVLQTIGFMAAHGNEAMFEECLRLRLPAIITATMRMHTENFAIQAKAAEAVGWLCNGGGESMALAVVQAKYFEQAMAAVKLHKNELGVQRAAWHSFHWLAFNLSGAQLDAFVDAGIEKSLNVAVNVHLKDAILMASVADWAGWVATNMAKELCPAVKLIVEVSETLLRILQRHAELESVTVCTETVKAFGCMAFHGFEALMRKLLEINVVFVVTEVYETFEQLVADSDGEDPDSAQAAIPAATGRRHHGEAEGPGASAAEAAAAAAAATTAVATPGSRNSGRRRVSAAQLEQLECHVAYAFNWLCLRGGAPLCAAVAGNARAVAVLLGMTVPEEQPADPKTGLRPPGKLNAPAAVDALEALGWLPRFSPGSAVTLLRAQLLFNLTELLEEEQQAAPVVHACLHALQWFLAGGGKNVWVEGDDDADPLFSGEAMALVVKWMMAGSEAATGEGDGKSGGGVGNVDEEERGEREGAAPPPPNGGGEADPDDVIVQTRGCAIVGSFLVGGESKAEKVVRMKKGIDAVLAAMQRYPASKDVQYQCCYTVAAVASMGGVDMHNVLQRLGCGELLLVALKQFQTSEQGVLWTCCSALKNLAESSRGNLRALRKLKAAKALVDARNAVLGSKSHTLATQIDDYVAPAYLAITNKDIPPPPDELLAALSPPSSGRRRRSRSPPAGSRRTPR